MWFSDGDVTEEESNCNANKWIKSESEPLRNYPNATWWSMPTLLFVLYKAQHPEKLN